MSEAEPDYPLISRYREWIHSDGNEDASERRAFFETATVVLDTNILLSLYEYTPPARNEILQALRSVQQRLWLPHQVGLEFFRGRHRVIFQRKEKLSEANLEVRKKLDTAKRSLADARDQVVELLDKYNPDSGAIADLRSALSNTRLQELRNEWQDALNAPLVKIKEEYDFGSKLVDSKDPVLPKVAELFGDSIADPPQPDVVRSRVEEAWSYRFPSQIPPGFADTKKGSPLSSSGDYLVWAEMIDYMRDQPPPSRILFVSNDTKEDWYQPAGYGHSSRPWPSLSSELRLLAGAELRIERPAAFFRGISEYLDAEIADETYEQIERAAEDATEPDITEEQAALTPPPVELAAAACDAAGLSSSVLGGSLDVAVQRTAGWWLIGVTAQLGLRERHTDEPSVSIDPATRAESPPASNWLSGTILHFTEWPYRSSSWIAPWFARIVDHSSVANRRILQQLAVDQLASKSS